MKKEKDSKSVCYPDACIRRTVYLVFDIDGFDYNYFYYDNSRHY